MENNVDRTRRSCRTQHSTWRRETENPDTTANRRNQINPAHTLFLDSMLLKIYAGSCGSKDACIDQQHDATTLK